MLTDDECRQFFAERDSALEAEINQLMNNAETKRRAAATIARAPSSRAALKLIENLREGAQGQAAPTSADGLASWLAEDARQRIAHAYAELLEAQLLERLRHEQQRLH